MIFFLHLLGIDNNGHAFRPSSPEYLNNIAIVDSGVEQIYHLIEKYFNYDNRTSYVFTADHGMSNKGSHGDSLPDNTDTPLICWGAGIVCISSLPFSSLFFLCLFSFPFPSFFLCFSLFFPFPVPLLSLLCLSFFFPFPFSFLLLSLSSFLLLSLSSFLLLSLSPSLTVSLFPFSSSPFLFSSVLPPPTLFSSFLPTFLLSPFIVSRVRVVLLSFLERELGENFKNKKQGKAQIKKLIKNK